MSGILPFAISVAISLFPCPTIEGLIDWFDVPRKEMRRQLDWLTDQVLIAYEPDKDGLILPTPTTLDITTIKLAITEGLLPPAPCYAYMVPDVPFVLHPKQGHADDVRRAVGSILSVLRQATKRPPQVHLLKKVGEEDPRTRFLFAHIDHQITRDATIAPEWVVPLIDEQLRRATKEAMQDFWDRRLGAWMP